MRMHTCVCRVPTHIPRVNRGLNPIQQQPSHRSIQQRASHPRVPFFWTEKHLDLLDGRLGASVCICSLMWYRPPRSMSSDHSLVCSKAISGSPLWLAAFIPINTRTNMQRFDCSWGLLEGFRYFLKWLTATYPAMYRTALHSICVSGLTVVVGAVSWLCFFARTLFFRIFFKSQSKSCSVSCGSWHGSGSCFPMKLLKVSLICWLQRNWWKANHREAWADEGNLCESPETRQSFSSQTRAVAMSAILPWESEWWSLSCFSSETQASKNSVYPGPPRSSSSTSLPLGRSQTYKITSW